MLESGSGVDGLSYPSDGGTESGSFPDPAVGFTGAESGVSVSAESAGVDLYYNTDADKYAADDE